MINTNKDGSLQATWRVNLLGSDWEHFCHLVCQKVYEVSDHEELSLNFDIWCTFEQGGQSSLVPLCAGFWGPLLCTTDHQNYISS